MSDWSFLTNHARALLFLAQHPGARLVDVAAALGVTERTAFSVVADLTGAGYVAKTKEGRRNRYQIQRHQSLSEPIVTDRTVRDLLALLTDVDNTGG